MHNTNLLTLKYMLFSWIIIVELQNTSKEGIRKKDG